MRLIDADKLLEELKKDEPFNWTDSAEEIQEVNDYKRIIHLIESQSTIDPVVHGHWNPNGKWVNCSVCGVINCKQKYCGECGAKMDEEFL